MESMPEPATPRKGPPPLRVRRWIGFTVLGESVGFLIPVTAFALAAALSLDGWTAWAWLVVFGAGEGALLGLGQALGLRGSRATVPFAGWIAATAVAASVAWGIGMLPSTLIDAGVAIDMTSPVTWVIAAPAALTLLATIPVAQRPLLARAGVVRSWWWVPINMGAWLVGIVFTFLPSPWVDESTPAAVTFALFAAAGVLMATTVAVLTGLGLRWMLRRQGGAPREAVRSTADT
ncbi:hypothetical protein ACI3KY_03880 [Microbacterium sp. ZW T2_14]|uniref:hypothetical protein n=1 Tax=Microbacterium sp. ZW T2_14 TaxID=3378079 RepID=UPI0038549421